MSNDLDALLQEKRIFRPSNDLIKQSNIKKWMNDHNIGDYDELLLKASENPEWFWDEIANELKWFKHYKKVLKWDPPQAEWFIEGKTNIVYNALDRHVEGSNKNKTAFIWEGEDGEVKKLTYYELYIEVNRLANALKSLGVKKGDRVSIYLPMILELPIAMLACAKIGAIHSVVFSGFSAKAFADRVKDAGSKIAITVDGFNRRGKVIKLKDKVDEILNETPTIVNVLVVRNTGLEVKMKDDRDIWLDEITSEMSNKCETVPVDSEDPLFILYTSGTTGKPKGVVHVHGGYAVGVYATLKFLLDIKDDDIWWCAADVGWITGHSYIVYAPLMHNITSILYEGAPEYPDPGRLWRMIEDYKASIFYTAPTTIRMFMKYGEEWPQKYDLSSLRILGSVGEPINPEVWIWYYRHIGGNKCPVIDTWWQTETGMQIIAPTPISNLKPGSVFKPFPSVKAEVVNDEGEVIKNQGGHLVIKTPWPAMFRTLYNEPDRYLEAYWSTFPNTYLSGDVARQDEDGYFWIQGREDDVMSVAGHRISSAEVESALVSHSDVAEAAVVGKPDPIKGEVIYAFVILKQGVKTTDNLENILKNHVRNEIGPIASPANVIMVPDLPKTNSGKIMRRVIKAKIKGESTGDISTLANPESVNELSKYL